MSDLPKGWAEVPLRDIAREGVFADGDWVESKDQDPKGAVRLIQLADIGEGRFLDKSSRFLTEAKAAELGCTFLANGDVLVSRMADPIGRACVFPGADQQCVTVVDVCIVRPTAAVDRRWLASAINSPQFRGKVELAASGTTRSRVSRGNLGSLTLPVPPSNEQRRIVAKLEALQERSRGAREALDAVPPLLEKLRQSILAAAFRGDLTKDWRAKNPDVEPADKLLARIRTERRKKWEEAELAKMKAKGKPPTDDKWKAKYKEPEVMHEGRLPQLPRGWCWTTLDELVWSIEAGRSPKAEGRPAGPGEAGVLKVSALSWGEFDPTENKALPSAEVIGDTPVVRAGDLLISRANTVQLVGAVVIARTDHPNLMLSDKTLRLNPASTELPLEFLLFGLRTRHVRKLFEDDATGTSDSMRNLSQEKLRAAPIALPSAPEATFLVQRVAAAIRAAHELELRLGRIVANGQDLERSLLAKAFRGELVPQDPSDEPADVMLARLRGGEATPSVDAPAVSTRRARVGKRKAG